MLEGDGSIRVWLGQILQIWLFTVGQGGPLSAYTQATMNPIIALPFQWYISLSLSLSNFHLFFEVIITNVTKLTTNKYIKSSKELC